MDVVFEIGPLNIRYLKAELGTVCAVNATCLDPNSVSRVSVVMPDARRAVHFLGKVVAAKE